MLPIGTKKPQPTVPPTPQAAGPQAGPPPEALAALAKLGGAPDTPDAAGSPDDAQGEAANPKRFGADRVDPQRAGYLGPEEGPFECQNCEFWAAPNACELVAGDIDPHGCCNLFTKGSAGDQGDASEEAQGAEQPDKAVAPTDDTEERDNGQQ